MATYDRMYSLFESRVKGDCSKKLTRTLLSPILLFFDMYEKEKNADSKQQLFRDVCVDSHFQWYHWTVDDHYGGIGEWREFPPVCVSQLNKAVRENKPSVRLMLAQRAYLIDFNEMTKRLVPDQQQQGFHPLHSSVPIYAKANLREGFSIDQVIQLEKQLKIGNERHRFMIKGILKLVKSSNVQPLDMELACTALTLLLRLISLNGMADEFLKCDGIQTLLQLRYIGQEPVANGAMTPAPALNVLATLILRQCIDANQDVLQTAFDQMVRATCNGQPISLQEITSRRHAMRTKRYQKDWKRVMRLLTPLAINSPEIYVDSIKKNLVIKQNELQLKSQEATNELQTAVPQIIRTMLKHVIMDLFQFDSLSDSVKRDRLIQPANLLKFVAELLRSYPSSATAFIESSLEGQSVIRWMIEKFLLSVGLNEPTTAGVSDALWAKAVLAELVSNSSTQRITDQIVGDIKALLYAAYDELSNNSLNAQTSFANRNNVATKFTDNVTILARLTIHLRECAQSNNLYTHNTSKLSSWLIKSIHKKNLANDFVKTIWSIPLHDKQGSDAINTLLKLFEGMMSKNVGGLEWASSGADRHIHHHMAWHSPHRFHFPYEDDEERAISMERAQNIVSVQGHDTSHNEANEPPTQSQEHAEADRSGDDSALGLFEPVREDTPAEISMMDSERTHDDNMMDEEEVQDEEDSEDDTPHDSDEDMDTAEEMIHQEPEEAHEGAMEDDHVSGAGEANEHEHAVHPNLAGDDELEEIEDDDDDEEDEEDEGEEGETMAAFEEALVDYFDMTDLAELAQEVRTIGHDIRRINMNINAVAAHQLHQHLPRNIRAMFGHHPRTGGAVLRIRADHHAHFARNLIEFDRFAATAFNGEQFGVLRRGDTSLGQLLSSLAGYGPPGTMPRDASGDRLVPCFIDRLAEWCKIIDHQSMFSMGTIISSYLVSVIEAPPDPPAEKQAEKPEQPQAGVLVPPSTENENSDTAQSMECQTQPSTENSDSNQPMECQTEHTQSDQTQTRELPPQAEQAPRDQIQSPETPPPPSEQQNQPETAATTTTTQDAGSAEGTAQPDNQQSERVGPASVPEGVDPAFLAALPEEMRQEVIRDHLLQQQLNHTTTDSAQPDQDLPPERIAAIVGMEIPEGMDPAFLAALPEDIFHEVVRDHQRQQELARQRQAQQQAAAQAMRHHHYHHHRAFAMPRWGHHRAAMRSAPGEGPSTTGSVPSIERTIQLFDRESICTLLMLYLLDQDKFDITRLQKLLKLVCMHPGTCDFTIMALLSMFDGVDKFEALESTDGVEGRKYQTGWVNEIRLQGALNRHERVLLITPSQILVNQQIRLPAAQRIIDTLAFLARGFARNFLPKQIRQSIGKSEQAQMSSNFWHIIRSINSRHIDELRKDTSKSMGILPEVVADSVEKSPLAHLFKLVDSDLAIANQAITDKIIRIISSLSQTISSDFHEKITEESKLWLNDRLRDITNVLMMRCTNDALRDGRALLVEMLRAVPSERQAILSAIHETIKMQGKLLECQLNSILEAIDGAGPKLLSILKDISGSESAPNRLLKSLETVQYLCNHLKKIDDARKKAEAAKKKEEEKEKNTSTSDPAQQSSTAASPIEETEEDRLLITMIDELKPLWRCLSKCLTLLERVEDSQHAVLCLQNAAEAFFLSYSLIIPSNGRGEGTEAPTSPISSGVEPPIPPKMTTSGPLSDLTKYQKDMFTFAERHRSVLNQILRGNTHNLESSAFAILTHFPKLLDFDVKRKYFHKELKKMDERDRYRHEDIAIRVRRTHLFGDSFRELYRLRPTDWKARLYIMFEGEEGQDAGGLLREWYSIITREIFNPNYALFINAPGDRVTYMINKSSYVNPEHLDYFRFVGRVIAKAIYDNKQLDCYFTRAFYKHILNVHVRYQDIESEDPDLFKSLEFLLNNAVEDLGTELNFSVEVEEFGVRSTRQLKENGLKLVVTDANKHEYVHLMCQMKMTGSIRQPLNAFLEGFYEVIPKKLISIFNEQELELLISGLPEIDIDDLCANTEYKTYTRTSPQIQWFWRALKSFDSEDKAKFLQFVTGTSKVPLQGFSHLEGMNGVQKFTIQKDTRSNDRLPSAHTCFNQLDLPEYADYESLHKMLLLASRECSEGFAFA